MESLVTSNSKMKTGVGGGHWYSAGCKANCGYEELLNMLSGEIEQFLL